MFKSLADWINDRTGYRALADQAFNEPIPGGARWRYVFGSALATVFCMQAFTGLLLMTAYSPSSSTAWGSVFYISHVMWMGWFIRGMHHFTAQAMIVLLALHVLQVLLAGAYRRPREFNWWFGMALLFVTLGFSLTGYLLPWDQKGYWATKVATNIMGGAPVIGPSLQKVFVGGVDYGNQTVTRFYGIHVGLLPPLLVACLAAHIALVRRHGHTPPQKAPATPSPAWPEQVFMNLVASVGVLSVIILVVLAHGGANLDAPADPSNGDYPARPEWYFLSLFQFLKLFPGRLEAIGTMVIPGAIVLVMLLLPLLDRILPRSFAHFLACGFVFGVLGGAGFLTVQAIRDDWDDRPFLAAREKADQARLRAIALALDPGVGVPPEGAGYLLARDPLTQGRAVLEKRCLGCHVHDGKGLGTQSASDLARFGTRDWLRGMLENPGAGSYFKHAKGCDGMMEWKRTTKLKPNELDVVADFVAGFASIPDDVEPTEWLNQKEVAEHPGLKLFQNDCGKCHVIDGLSEGGLRDAPGLFAWGSPRWFARMIRKPDALDRYGYLETSNRMPAFGTDQVSDADLNMIIRYLKDDYLKPAAAPAQAR